LIRQVILVMLVSLSDRWYWWCLWVYQTDDIGDVYVFDQTGDIGDVCVFIRQVILVMLVSLSDRWYWWCLLYVCQQAWYCWYFCLFISRQRILVLLGSVYQETEDVGVARIYQQAVAETVSRYSAHLVLINQIRTDFLNPIFCTGKLGRRPSQFISSTKNWTFYTAVRQRYHHTCSLLRHF
jgi:hypothetical protein